MKPAEKDMDFAALLLLGANLPYGKAAPSKTLSMVLPRLSALGANLTACSRLYQTPCFPAGAGPDFVNAAVAVDWQGTPQELLQVLHQIETEFGRERNARWSARTLDLDLAAFGGLVLPDIDGWRRWAELDLDAQQAAAPDRLILPHPRLAERAFVLRPLADIAPDWVHPILGESVETLLGRLDPAEIAAIQPISDPDWPN